MDKEEAVVFVDTSTAKTSEIVSQVGASVLMEIVKTLDGLELDRSMTPACLAVAVAGCLMMADLSVEEFVNGVKAAAVFWKEEDDEVVFVEQEDLLEEESELSADTTSEGAN